MRPPGGSDRPGRTSPPRSTAAWAAWTRAAAPAARLRPSQRRGSTALRHQAILKETHGWRDDPQNSASHATKLRTLCNELDAALNDL